MLKHIVNSLISQSDPLLIAEVQSLSISYFGWNALVDLLAAIEEGLPINPPAKLHILSCDWPNGETTMIIVIITTTGILSGAWESYRPLPTPLSMPGQCKP